MNKKIKLTISFFILIIISVNTYSDNTIDDLSIESDLNTALTLQGIDCDGISNVEKNSNNEYEVVCKDGGNFIISQTKNGFLSIVDNLTGLVLKSFGTILGFVPFSEMFFKVEGDVTEHDVEIARSLFSIIELSGNACEAIVGVTSHESGEHSVDCENDMSYRVYTNDDGVVAVDRILNGG
jgi:hypothetical protein